MFVKPFLSYQNLLFFSSKKSPKSSSCQVQLNNDTNDYTSFLLSVLTVIQVEINTA